MTSVSRVSPDTVRALALALPQVIESEHFGQPDFRVLKRIFATLPKTGDAVCIKSTPVNLDFLIASDSLTFRDEWRGRWLRVRLDRVTTPVLEDLLVDAWALVAPKSLVRSFLSKAKSPRIRTV